MKLKKYFLISFDKVNKMCINESIVYILLLLAIVYMLKNNKQRIIDTSIIHPASL